MKSDESKQKLFFYIDDAEEGEVPLPLHSIPRIPQIFTGQLETTVCITNIGSVCGLQIFFMASMRPRLLVERSQA